MRGRVNDSLRNLIGLTIIVLGLIATRLFRLRIVVFTFNQARLKRKYGITLDTPVMPYGPLQVQSIQRAAKKAGRSARFAETSGSTGKPKQILYTRRRLLALKLTFSDMFARACYAFRIKRTSLYVFNSFQPDASLTSLLLDEWRLPNYFATLQAPYRIEQQPCIRALVSNYGPAAVRLWILTLANPGVLYSTNPSSISTFLDELTSDWTAGAHLSKDWYEHPASFALEVRKLARRIESRGCAQRLKQIAMSDGPLPLSVCAPAIAAYICWTGGYVKPFLDRLERQLAAPQYRLIPMYSMSTETIETLPYFHSTGLRFLPLASRVLYEFIAETEVDQATNLLNARQLKPGKLYTMVVSDAYGLRRYQTDDLFLCRRTIAGLPDLAFMRRRSVEHSFTGEKLTAEQLSLVFEHLRAQYPALVANRFLSCVPAQDDGSLPYYKVLIAGNPRPESHGLLATRCDELLKEINCEYKSKRASGRLGPIMFVDVQRHEFPAQFKFLPLYRDMECAAFFDFKAI